METFIVDKTRKKNLINYIKENHKKTFIIGYSIALLIPIVAAYLGFTFLDSKNFFNNLSIESMIIDGGWGILLIYIGFVSIAAGIAKIIWSYVGEEYLDIYSKKMDYETLCFDDENMVMVHAFRNKGARHASTIWPYVEIVYPYDDIQKIEYDEVNRSYRIFGDNAYYEWSNISKESCCSSSSVKESKKIKRLFGEKAKQYETFFSSEFADYFEDNNRISEIFQEKFGDKFVRKTRDVDELIATRKAANKYYVELQREETRQKYQ